ncbi:MAG: right-handed parallel beta-helix repeat-containing protein [Ignavibacteria bacterium]|nr:right-handed parallel beta-helix repeat-containing protein [Ignavibacteria bacterium]
MIKIISLLFLLLTIFHISPAYATTYYISNSGNDNNNGLSPVFPFKSLDKLNSVIKLLKPGDVILFERNGFFAGQIFLNVSGSEKLSIIFAAYGEGRNPVISGSMQLKNWSQYRENIYTSDVNYPVKNLFVSGEQMILARYPNTGFLTIKSEVQNPKTGFIDNSLDQPKNYWKDANVRMRTTNWSYEHTPVKNFDNGRITFLNPTLYPANKGWGYYLDNKLNELDAGKEWYYEDKGDSTGIVYLYAPANVNPNSVYTQGSIYPYGIFSNQNISNIIIRELKCMNQYEYGILFTGKSKSNIRIENCTFSGQINGGVSILNPSYNFEIINCRFYNINGKALYILKAENSKVNSNVIKNTGLIPGYGMNSEAQNNSSLIVMYSNSNIVSYNYILNTGHDGINCVGSNNIVEKNIIQYLMLKLNDGGGVKGYGNVNTNSAYRNNYISHIIGNNDGTAGSYSNIVVTGIYLDEHSNNMKVLNNTISESNNYGIFLYNNCNNNTISGNISYNNKVGINFF